MEPFSQFIDRELLQLVGAKNVSVRKLSDMKEYYEDQEAVKIMLNNNPTIYEVHATTLPEEEGHLSFATTTIHPGKVGKEFFMTKGHYHEREGTAEIYIGLKGEGVILMQTKDGQSRPLEVKKDWVVYVPPHWAHRSINTGKEDFSFLAIYHSNAGHDYAEISEKGFCKIMIEENGEAQLIDNPRCK